MIIRFSVLSDECSKLTIQIYAGLAQLIERFLAKEEAGGLSPPTRTNEKAQCTLDFFIGLRLKSTASSKIINSLGAPASQSGQGLLSPPTRTIRNWEPEKGSFLSVRFGF